MRVPRNSHVAAVRAARATSFNRPLMTPSVVEAPVAVVAVEAPVVEAPVVVDAPVVEAPVVVEVPPVEAPVAEEAPAPVKKTRKRKTEVVEAPVEETPASSSEPT